MTNSITAIECYDLGGIWVFDDERYGLKGEAFIAGSTEALNEVLKEKTDRCVVTFSDQSFPSSTHYLMRVGQLEEGGYWYNLRHRNGEAYWDTVNWLCPATLHYFPEGHPKEIHLQAKPTN